MEKYLDTKISRRSLMTGGLKAAAVLGAASGAVPLLAGRSWPRRQARPW